MHDWITLNDGFADHAAAALAVAAFFAVVLSPALSAALGWLAVLRELGVIE